MRCQANSGTHSRTPTHYNLRGWHTSTHTKQWTSPTKPKLIHFRHRVSIWRNWASVSHASCQSVLLYTAAKSNCLVYVCECAKCVCSCYFCLELYKFRHAHFKFVTVWCVWLYVLYVLLSIYYRYWVQSGEVMHRWLELYQRLIFSFSGFLVCFIGTSAQLLMINPPPKHWHLWTISQNLVLVAHETTYDKIKKQTCLTW